MELARQLLQTPVSLLVRLNEFNTQIVRVGFRHLLQPEVSPRAVYIIDENALVSSLTKKVGRGDRFQRPEKNTFWLRPEAR